MLAVKVPHGSSVLWADQWVVKRYNRSPSASQIEPLSHNQTTSAQLKRLKPKWTQKQNKHVVINHQQKYPKARRWCDNTLPSCHTQYFKFPILSLEQYLHNDWRPDVRRHQKTEPRQRRRGALEKHDEQEVEWRRRRDGRSLHLLRHIIFSFSTERHTEGNYSSEEHPQPTQEGVSTVMSLQGKQQL